MENYNNVETNSLTVYGNIFQSKCIATLLSDRSFLERIFDILSTTFFETDSHRWIINKINEYFIKFKEVPTMEVFKVEIKALGGTQEVLKQAVFDEIKNAYSHVNDIDSKYIKEQFLTFCKQMKLKTAIWNSVEHLKSGNYDAIKDEVDAAMKAGIERNLGHEYLEDVEKRMSEMARSCVKTGWEIIDQRLDGGLGKGELGFIIGSAGGGKSWILARLGAEAMKQGKNVLHVTLELNEHYVGLRYDAYLTEISFQDVRKNIAQVKTRIEELRHNGCGRVFIKYFPLKSVSSVSIKAYIEQLQLITGIKIDLLIVDYADIIRPNVIDRNANSYSEAGSIYEELRQIAGELSLPLWSASQGQRSSTTVDVIGAEKVADSFKKIMTGDFIISLSRKIEDKVASTGRIHVVKNRFGPDGETFPVEFNASNGMVKLYDKDSPEGKAIMSKTKDLEEDVMTSLNKKWTEHKANGGTEMEQE